MLNRILSFLRTITFLTVFASLALAGPGGSGYPKLFSGPGNGQPYLTEGPGSGGGYLLDGPGLGGGYLTGPGNGGYGRPTR
jgi:hypothetical protein